MMMMVGDPQTQTPPPAKKTLSRLWSDCIFADMRAINTFRRAATATTANGQKHGSATAESQREKIHMAVTKQKSQEKGKK